MLRVMTKREVRQLDKDMDEWWLQLDPTTKSTIFHFAKNINKSKDIIKATECHDKKITKRGKRTQKALLNKYYNDTTITTNNPNGLNDIYWVAREENKNK